MVFPILFLALLATAIGQSVFITTMPSLARETGISEFQVAVIMSSSACIFALCTTKWSRLAARWGFRRTLLLGLTGYSGGTLLFATVWFSGLNGWLTGGALFCSLLVCRSLQSTIMSASPPSAVGYTIAISSPENRVKSISRVTSANNLGQVLGPVFAGGLVSFGLLVPMYAVVSLTLLALLLTWVKLPEQHTAPLSSANVTSNVSRSDAPSAQTTLLITICVGLFACMAMMQQCLAFFLIDEYAYTPVDAAQGVGVAMMVSAIASLSVQFLFVQRTTIRSERLIHLALPLLVMGYLGLYLHQSIIQLNMAMILLGAGMGVGYPSVASVATSRCAEEKQSTVTGLITASPAMGYITGPPIAALLYTQNARLPFIAAASILALLLILALKNLPGKRGF